MFCTSAINSVRLLGSESSSHVSQHLSCVSFSWIEDHAFDLHACDWILINASLLVRRLIPLIPSSPPPGHTLKNMHREDEKSAATLQGLGECVPYEGTDAEGGSEEEEEPPAKKKKKGPGRPPAGGRKAAAKGSSGKKAAGAKGKGKGKAKR